MESVSMANLLAKLQEARAVASGLPAPTAAQKPKEGDFATALKASIDKVDKAQGDATKVAEQFQLGDPKVTLEETMVAMQKANVSFQAALQVRNRLVQAYHDIMNLQI